MMVGPGIDLDDLVASMVAAVSDGSFDPVLQLATSAFIISPSVDCRDKSVFITGANYLTGNPADINAY